MILSLCMIVKNEEMHIERCLKSVQGIVDEIIIVDTGSTDRTIELAKQFHPTIINYQWNNDFSAARNAGIDVAKGKYILVLDADEELAPNSKETIQEAISQEAEGYMVFLENVHEDLNSTSILIRLFRNTQKYRWSYPIHEQIADSIMSHGGNIVTSEIRIMHYGYTNSEAKRKDRTSRNTAILESIRHLDNPYFLYQLAIEYTKAERFEEVDQLYQQCFPKFTPKYLIYSEVVAGYMINCIHLKNYQKAHELFDNNIDRYRDYLELYSIDGKAYLAEGNYASALNRFRSQLEVKPNKYYKSTVGIDTFIPLYNIGQVYEMMGERQFALSCYQKAFQLKPNSYTFMSIVEIIGDYPDQMNQLIDDISQSIDFTEQNNLNILLLRLVITGKRNSFQHIRGRFPNTSVNEKLFNALWDGDLKLAITELERVGSGRAESLIQQIQRYLMDTRLKAADLELAIALGWDNPDVLLKRSDSSEHLKVLHLMHRAKGLNSVLPNYINLYQKGIYDELSLYYIGEALRETGDNQAATQMYSLSCKFQPTSMSIFRLVESALKINDYKTAELLVADGLELFKESLLLNQTSNLLKNRENM